MPIANAAISVDLPREATEPQVRHGLRHVLGEPAWQRLPSRVQARFSDMAGVVDYEGVFEVVHASGVGWVIAQMGRLIGTPVVPWVGSQVPALVRVEPDQHGIAWIREYRRCDGSLCTVRSTKTVASDGTLIEQLPARLCMPLEVYEEGGDVHFVSRGYYVDLGLLVGFGPLHLWLPDLLSPGTTHVIHADEYDGWFRFTMIVIHPWFGEILYQTGRFHAAEEAS